MTWVDPEAKDSESDVGTRLSRLLWELTGGRLSKPTYDVQTMLAEVDDYHERWCDAASERDDLAARFARVEELVEPCEHFVAPYSCLTRDSGKALDAEYAADRACLPCRLRAALDAKALRGEPE